MFEVQNSMKNVQNSALQLTNFFMDLHNQWTLLCIEFTQFHTFHVQNFLKSAQNLACLTYINFQNILHIQQTLLLEELT